MAPPELLPTVVTACILGINASSIVAFASLRVPFGNMKKATSVTGAARAADASEVKQVYAGSDSAPQVRSTKRKGHTRQRCRHFKIKHLAHASHE